MLHGLHGVGGAPGDGGHVVQRQVGHEAQGHDLALIGPERVQRRHEGRVDRICRWGRLGGGQAPVDDPGPTRPPPVGIGHSVVGDGEHPSPEVGGIAREPVEVTAHLQEHLAEQVLGVGCPACPQVTEDRGSQLSVGRLGIGLEGGRVARSRHRHGTRDGLDGARGPSRAGARAIDLGEAAHGATAPAGPRCCADPPAAPEPTDDPAGGPCDTGPEPPAAPEPADDPDAAGGWSGRGPFAPGRPGPERLGAERAGVERTGPGRGAVAAPSRRSASGRPGPWPADPGRPSSCATGR